MPKYSICYLFATWHAPTFDNFAVSHTLESSILGLKIKTRDDIKKVFEPCDFSSAFVNQYRLIVWMITKS